MRSSRRYDRLRQAKILAEREYNLDVSWPRLVEDHPELIEDLSEYEKRRVGSDFEMWVFSMRNPGGPQVQSL